MASPTRSRAREKFLLVVGGIPSSWSWEELKDFVKQTTARIRAEVVDRYPDAPANSQHKVGFITVNGRADAQRLYDVLENSVLNGCRILVYFFNITNETELIDCNSGAFGLTGLCCGAALSAYLNIMSQGPPNPTADASLPGLPATFMPALLYNPGVPTTAPMTTPETYQPVYTAPCGYFLQPDSCPPREPHPMGLTYPVGWNGVPINTANGYYETVLRGIHISQLSYETSKRELEDLVRAAGSPLNISLNTNSAGRSKGSATVLFGSPMEAQCAVDLFDGRMIDGRYIRVRLDRDASETIPEHATTPGVRPVSSHESRSRQSQPPLKPPIVVDGSNSRGEGSKRHKNPK